MPFLKEARERGAKLVVIDPRATNAGAAGRSVPAGAPGHRSRRRARAPSSSVRRRPRRSGVSRRAHDRRRPASRERAQPWTFERAAEVSGVPADRSCARSPISTRRKSPALVKCGWGLERNRNGGSAAAAVLALPAVGGKFGVRGGGYSMSNSASWNIDRTWVRDPEPPTRAINMNHLGGVSLTRRNRVARRRSRCSSSTTAIRR